MNETVCDHLIESVKWTDPGRIISLAVLEFINILVIVGNCLVIAAVFCSNKLRSVTNYFIVNLAVADLLVGLAVLPFSATWEVYKVWIFGDVWCRVWLAVDVWMCTASILNLCAISLDRYVAVTRPVTYPSIMSTKKAKSLIAGIWVLSFVICFPPLVGWKDQKPDTGDIHYSRGNVTLYFATSEPPTMVLPTPEPCPWKCELTNDRGYVLYSALGSFYIPMFVMLFFYWRIYRAAVRTTRAINQGFKTTKGCKGTASHPLNETTFTLRIHRGRSNKSDKSTAKTQSLTTESTTTGGSLKEGSKGIGSRFEEQRLTLRIHRGRGSSNQHESPHSNGSTHSTTTTLGTPSPERLSRFATRKHEKIKISVSYPSSENIHDLSQTNAAGSVLYSVHYTAPNGKDTTASQLFRHPHKDGYLQVGGCGKGLDMNKTSGSPRPSKKMGKRNIKAQVKRFRMETKAAKTLAIIVGLFILCWLPFFTMYVIRGFCEECIDPLLFSVLFWLGYCNSAVNPMIYALFSKDFRFAFKRVICRCFCSNQRFSQKTSRRDSDMSAIRHAGVRTPSISPSAAAHSLGEESDHVGDMSDSR